MELFIIKPQDPACWLVLHQLIMILQIIFANLVHHRAQLALTLLIVWVAKIVYIYTVEHALLIVQQSIMRTHQEYATDVMDCALLALRNITAKLV
jgi:hypothetical protein